MPLFVTLSGGTILDPALGSEINAVIKAHASPRHVPDEVIQAPALPHTLTGKRLQVPIKRILQGTPITEAVNPSSIDAPDVLQWFADIAAHRLATTASGSAQTQ